MVVFHKRTLFPIYDAEVRLRQDFRLRKTTPKQAGGTDFLASFAVVLRLQIHPLFAELACPDDQI